MEQFGAAILALVIGAAITSLELITARYPRTWFLLSRNRTLYLYALIYGAIAFAIALGFDVLIRTGTVKIEGAGLSSPWVRAIVVGLTVKAFLHVNLFNVSVGSQSVPVGIETLVQLFEPEMLRTLLLDEFNAVRIFIEPRALKYPDLAVDKVRIKANIPPTLSAIERAAFENDVDTANDVTQVMERFLRFLGRQTFDRVFPP